MSAAPGAAGAGSGGGTAAVAAVLWDADGVLQHLPAGWEASMRPVVGHLVDDVEGFLAEAFAAERPALTGDARWVEVLPKGRALLLATLIQFRIQRARET